MIVKFKALRPGFELPKKNFETDACFDVKVMHIERNHDVCVCYLGFATEIEPGFKGVITPRSGITKIPWAMQNSPGQVDSDYRGEWMVKFRCFDIEYPSQYKDPFAVGERCAQIYFERVNEVELVLTEELSETSRGSGGFGSSGK